LSEATINVSEHPDLGPILVDGEGMTLYIFTEDEPNQSNCDAECLERWPPLLTQGSPTLGDGVDPALVGSTELADGSSIVTYNEMPLYYWWRDEQPGDVDGQSVGDVWYVINPAGEMIQDALPEADATAETTQSPDVTEGAPEGTPAGSGLSEVTLTVANDPTLGPILVDQAGMTLYMFTKDEANQSNCDAECLERWPPLISQGSPTAAEGIDPDLIGTAEMADGRLIVTYNQMPLYYWFEDAQPGDTAGQGVGEVWYVVAPDGTPVGLQPAQPTVAATPKPDKPDTDPDY
jgi:predicted lipoprotein with Yx(FWY)xxD motif